MPFNPVTSAPLAWNVSPYSTAHSSMPASETAPVRFEQPPECSTAPGRIDDDHQDERFGVTDESHDQAPPFNDRVRHWLHSMLPPSHEAVASKLRSALMSAASGSDTTAADKPTHQMKPYVDFEQVNATRDMRSRKHEHAERRARALGFYNRDGSGDIRSMQRTRLHRTVIAQGFIKPDGTADPQAYSKNLKVHEFQRGLAIRSAGKPLSEYWNHTLERFSRLAGFSNAAGVGDVDAYAQHLASLPERKIPKKRVEIASRIAEGMPNVSENISETITFRRPRVDLNRSKLNDCFREKAFMQTMSANALSHTARELALAARVRMTPLVKKRLEANEEAARQSGFKYLDGSGNIARYQLHHVEQLIDAGAFTNPDGTTNSLERDKYVISLTALNEGFVNADQTPDSRGYCAYKLEQYSRRAGFEIRGAGDVTTYLNALRLQVEQYGESLETGLAFMWERTFHAFASR